MTAQTFIEQHKIHGFKADLVPAFGRAIMDETSRCISMSQKSFFRWAYFVLVRPFEESENGVIIDYEWARFLLERGCPVRYGELYVTCNSGYVGQVVCFKERDVVTAVEFKLRFG